MAKDERWLERARKIAEVSTCNKKHGAVVIRGGSVLAVGVNTLTNPVSMFDVCGGRVSSHAEVSALKSLDFQADGATLYVARVNRKGQPLLSKPCGNCTQIIARSGIKRVVWTEGRR